MSLNTIRTFRIADQTYRHAMCTDEDHVFLQRYQDNESAVCDDDLWVTLLKYDRNCSVWAAGGVKVGDFQLEGTAEQWVFYENPLRARIEFPPNRGPEALLDAEVRYSRRWLANQAMDQVFEQDEVTIAAAGSLQLQIDLLKARQDEMMRPPVMRMLALINQCPDVHTLERLNAHLDTWPAGFDRSELRSAWFVRLEEVRSKRAGVHLPLAQ